MDNPQESSCVLSTCTGYGGLELGLAECLGPLRVVAYVEREAYACANLVAKVEAGALPCAPIWTDLKTFDARPLRGCVDILTGGYPCQPFSLAGKRLGEADPRHLWPDYVRLIQDCEPRWCFFENVRGHVSKGLRDVRSDLESLGYRVECGLFSAAEVGAPHRRERVYILARSDANGRGFQEHQEPDREPHAGQAVQQRDDAVGLCDVVANADNPGLEVGARIGGDTRPERSATFGSGRPWAAEPDVGRVANGCADRVDRLRLLGNGVVPACAAHAFRTLRSRFSVADYYQP